MLKIVLDTNVFLVSLVSDLKYYWVFEKLINNKYELAVSNEILTEYLEVVSQRYGLPETETKLDFLLLFPNVRLVIPYYHWQLIENDNDDNKFVDCAVASNADYLVTNDRHFNVLKDIGFPKINVINVEEFQKILLSGQK
jgi:putative PIN family toxin of toxin-antitoxin system